MATDNLSDIIHYLYKHKCSCLIIKIGIHAYEAMNTLLMEDRYGTFEIPIPGDTMTIHTPYGKARLMFVIDPERKDKDGYELIEFNTIEPDNYMRFQGEK